MVFFVMVFFPYTEEVYLCFVAMLSVFVLLSRFLYNLVLSFYPSIDRMHV